MCENKHYHKQSCSMFSCKPYIKEIYIPQLYSKQQTLTADNTPTIQDIRALISYLINYLPSRSFISNNFDKKLII